MDGEGFGCYLFKYMHTPSGDIVDCVAGDDRMPEDLRPIVANQQFAVVRRQRPRGIGPLVLDV